LKVTLILAVAVLLAFLGAWIGASWTLVGVVLAGFGAVGLAFASKRSGLVVFMIVVVLLLVVASASWSWKSLLNWGWTGAWWIPFDSGFKNEEHNGRGLLGSYEGIAILDVSAPGVHVEFEKGRSDVEVYEIVKGVRVERLGDTLKISASSLAKRARAYVKTGGLHRLRINAAGAMVDGDIDVDDMDVDGAGVYISGSLRCDTLKIDGAGAKIDVDVIECNRFNIDAAGVNGTVRFIQPWDGVRTVSVDAVGVDLRVILPRGVSRDQLKISGSHVGKIKVEEEGL